MSVCDLAAQAERCRFGLAVKLKSSPEHLSERKRGAVAVPLPSIRVPSRSSIGTLINAIVQICNLDTSRNFKHHSLGMLDKP